MLLAVVWDVGSRAVGGIGVVLALLSGVKVGVLIHGVVVYVGLRTGVSTESRRMPRVPEVEAMAARY